jgi:hypothetical protein
MGGGRMCEIGAANIKKGKQFVSHVIFMYGRSAGWNYQPDTHTINDFDLTMETEIPIR